MNIDDTGYEERHGGGDRHNFKTSGRNKSSSKSDRRPGVDNNSARQLDSLTSKSRQTRDKPSKTKPKRQDQPLYQPRRSERATGSKQETKEEVLDSSERQETSPEAVTSKNRKPTQQLYTNKFQQSHPTEDLPQKPLSPVAQVKYAIFDEICIRTDIGCRDSKFLFDYSCRTLEI